MSLFGKIIPHRKKTGKNFLVIEIGLGRVNVGIFKVVEARPHLVNVGRKTIASYENIFNTVLEAVDTLAALNKDIPKQAIFGVTDGVLRTTTTVARFERHNPKEAIDAEEASNVLEKISSAVKAEPLKVFFSTIASAKIDGTTVTNPVGLKGAKAELACFIALKSKDELAIFDKLIDELDLSVNKVLPASFSVSRELLKQNLNDALIVRLGKEKSEGSLLSEGHIFEILPFDLGETSGDYLTFGLEAMISLLEKEKRPDTIWLYPDEEDVDCVKVAERLEKFPWGEKLGYEKPPTIVTKQIIENVEPGDIALTSLANEFLEG